MHQNQPHSTARNTIYIDVTYLYLSQPLQVSPTHYQEHYLYRCHTLVHVPAITSLPPTLPGTLSISMSHTRTCPSHYKSPPHTTRNTIYIDVTHSYMSQLLQVSPHTTRNTIYIDVTHSYMSQLLQVSPHTTRNTIYIDVTHSYMSQLLQVSPHTTRNTIYIDVTHSYMSQPLQVSLALLHQKALTHFNKTME